jgi:tetratricopeptide (TPR) repeat protein
MSDWNRKEEALHSRVDAWIQWARQELPKGGNIPAIFNALGDSWWTDARDVPWVTWVVGNVDRDVDRGGLQLLSTVERFLLGGPSDLPTRFVALSVYYGLAHFPSIYAETDLLAEAQERHARTLAYLVRLVPTEDCHDWRTIRWEILNAYVISDWDRALELYNRAEKLNLLPLTEIRVLRAQFRFLVALGKATVPTVNSLLWPPDVYSPGSGRSELLFLAGLPLPTPEYAFPDSDKEMLGRAALDLKTALAQRDDLSPAYHAVLARCYFLTGHFHDAGKEYERLEGANVLKVFKDVSPGHAVYLSAAASYRESGEREKAIAVLEKCAADFPDAIGVHLEIAKLWAMELNLPAISEALRKELECNPGVDLWFVSPLIVAGETWTHTEQDKARLRARPQYEQIQPPLSEYWPAFAKLDPEARKEWIFGILETHFSMAQGHIRDTYKRKAIASFAQAVEMELSSKVFQRFREYALGDPGIRAPAAQAIKEKADKLMLFASFIEDEIKGLTLRQMTNIVKWSSKNSAEPLFQELGSWLQQNHPRLTDHVGLLYKIDDFRNPALHRGVSVETIESIHGWCRTVIESLGPA